MYRRKAGFALVVFLLTILFVACSQAEVEPVVENEEEEVPRVVLIGNSPFGDRGPMDDYARGLDQCAERFGFEIKKLESTEPARNEEDVRAMVREGYDLIMTTFPGMTEPTKAVAQDNPDQNFVAVYQLLNAGEEKMDNVWSTEYRGYEAGYVMGAFAGKMTDSKEIGFIAGMPSESINSDINGFLQGVEDTCSDCSVEVGFAGNWDDPALGKELANAMISRGIDFIQTEASKTQLGAIEAAQEGEILISGDNGDNYELYPEGFVSWIGWSFARNIELACEYLRDGELPIGEHTYMDLGNGGVFIRWEDVERFANDNLEWADRVSEAMSFARDIQEQVIGGDIEVEYNPETPTGLD